MVNVSVLDAPKRGTKVGSEFTVGDIVVYSSLNIVGLVKNVSEEGVASLITYHIYFHFNDERKWDLSRSYRSTGDLLVKIGHIDGAEAVWK